MTTKTDQNGSVFFDYYDPEGNLTDEAVIPGSGVDSAMTQISTFPGFFFSETDTASGAGGTISTLITTRNGFGQMVVSVKLRTFEKHLSAGTRVA